jgi:glycine cleavage system H protein
MTSADATEPRPDEGAVSPAIGPLPAIYVPSSPSQASRTSLLWHAAVRAARRADGWAVRHLSGPIGGTMSDIPADLRYSRDHLWIRAGAGTGLVRVGVTDFAQQSLGDVVEVTLPELGETIRAGQACGDIESVKSVNDLVAPVAGTVRTRNDDLAGTPELVNTDPYGQGWMFEAEIDPSTRDRQLAGLMDAGAYRDLAGA